MSYAVDLADLAKETLNHSSGIDPQARRRRAVSTAYYALFHLLIEEAVSNYPDPAFQSALARVFDHGGIKQACDRKSGELGRPVTEVEHHLRTVCVTFAQVYYDRNDADYNLRHAWTHEKASLVIDKVSKAFESWAVIRNEPEARQFLASMLPGKDRRRP